MTDIRLGICFAECQIDHDVADEITGLDPFSKHSNEDYIDAEKKVLAYLIEQSQIGTILKNHQIEWTLSEAFYRTVDVMVTHKQLVMMKLVANKETFWEALTEKELDDRITLGYAEVNGFLVKEL